MEYIGKTKNGKFDGFGILKNPKDGHVYKGIFKDGIAHGYGALTNNNNIEIIGTFENGLLNGYTTVKYPCGSTFKGTYKNHMRNGIGIEYWINGQTICGFYENDVRVKTFD